MKLLRLLMRIRKNFPMKINLKEISCFSKYKEFAISRLTNDHCSVCGCITEYASNNLSSHKNIIIGRSLLKNINPIFKKILSDLLKMVEEEGWEGKFRITICKNCVDKYHISTFNILCKTYLDNIEKEIIGKT